MSDLLSATLAPVRVTEATRDAVRTVADQLGLSEADIQRTALRMYLSSDGGVCPECGCWPKHFSGGDA